MSVAVHFHLSLVDQSRVFKENPTLFTGKAKKNDSSSSYQQSEHVPLAHRKVKTKDKSEKLSTAFCKKGQKKRRDSFEPRRFYAKQSF